MRFASLALLLFACGRDDGLTSLDGRVDVVDTYDVPDFRRVDRTVQVPQPAVDVLFVIDNSCSMDAEQQRLARNFPIFMDYMATSGTDYHIGVISTDNTSPSAGQLQSANGHRWIDTDTPNPSSVFSQMALLGTGGSIDESGRSTAYTALELNADHPANTGFEREDAELHLIFISDEDDASTNDPISRSEWRTWLRNRKATPEAVRAHGLIWPTGASCPDGFSEGTTYERYAAWTDGIIGNICDPSWDAFLDQLGLLTAGLKTEFFLADLPQLDPWSIQVVVETLTPAGDPVTLRFESCEETDTGVPATCEAVYRPRRNSVTFLDFVPGPFDEVFITYMPRSVGN